MKVKIEWTNNKEDFVTAIEAGEWYIMENDILITGDQRRNMKGPSEGRNQIKHVLFVASPTNHPTTTWLRIFCSEHHPEIDFDKEFETDKPGVFARYQEKFGHDYEESVREMQYEALKEELSKKSCEFPWED